MSRPIQCLVTGLLAVMIAPAVYAGDGHVVDSVFQLSGFGKCPHGDANCQGCRGSSGPKIGKPGYDVGDYADSAAESYADTPQPEMQDYGFLAMSAGATPAGLSAAPGMIGDFFGAGYSMRFGSAGQFAQDPGTAIPGVVVPHGTTLPVAAGDRRFKVADNTSPFPTDRYFINYHHFHGALLTARGRPENLDRVILGLEKTFFDGTCSLEMRLPFSSGLAANQSVYAGSDNTATDFGNIGFALKRLIYQNQCVKASMGLAMVVPTARDTTLRSASDDEIVVEYSNDAFYLQPFLGLMYTPNDCWFFQSFFQFDFDTTGNKLRFADGQGGNGTIQDQTLMYMDYSLGYWVFHDPCGDRLLTGFAPMMELHYTTTLNDTDSISRTNGLRVDETTNFAGRQDMLNITGGFRFELWGCNYLTVAGVAPLRDGLDKIFDAEFNVQFVGLY